MYLIETTKEHLKSHSTYLWKVMDDVIVLEKKWRYNKEVTHGYPVHNLEGLIGEITKWKIRTNGESTWDVLTDHEAFLEMI